MTIHPYVNFNGNCEAAFNFYAKVLDGKIIFKMTHGESPMAQNVGPEWQGKIMHATVEVAGQLIQGMDAPPEYFKTPAGFSLALSVKEVAEAERLFAALAEGGSVQMSLAKTFWSDAFGVLTDQFGVPWMINCEPANSAPIT